MILLLSESNGLAGFGGSLLKDSILTYWGHQNDMALILLVIQASNFLVFSSLFETRAILPFQMSFHLDHSLVSRS